MIIQKRIKIIAEKVTFSQVQDFSSQVTGLRKYSPSEAIDPDYGIVIYDKLIFAIGGDSLRYNAKGYNIQGWKEDYYTDGSLLHKGYYEDGQLKVFKNYYPNGQMERSFRVTDLKRCELTTFHQDGKIKSEVSYYEQNTQRQVDYFANGNIEYIEESDKNNEYLFKRNSYKEDGVPVVIFELVDKKKKTYLHKEFYEGGKPKEEGSMKLQASSHDYAKDGQWTYYDVNGNITKKEKYHNGSLVE